MNLIDKICELWGRTLSPIEAQKILNIKDSFNEEVILEAAMLSMDKVHPMQYMMRILYYVNHPMEKKEEAKEPKVQDTSGSKWLDDFLNN